MGKKLFVGNLSYRAKDSDVRDLFIKFGRVVSVRIPVEGESNRPRGFGFVEMETEALAEKAKEALHGTLFMGRDLVVDIAKPAPAKD